MEQGKIYPAMSGHNTICVATALVETGMVASIDGEAKSANTSQREPKVYFLTTSSGISIRTIVFIICFATHVFPNSMKKKKCN